MKHLAAASGATRIEDCVHAIHLELQHIEFALLRLRKCTQLMLSLDTSSAADIRPLEQMYEDLERAIRAPAPAESAAATVPVPVPVPEAAAAARVPPQDARRPRPRVALLPSRLPEPTELSLQRVQAPQRAGATSCAAR